jgi:hypothetical protein
MKISLEKIDKDSFMKHSHFIGNEEFVLVQPISIGSKYTPENLIFRSSVWTKDGLPVSLSWKKFFNWDEQPSLDGIPSSLQDAELMEKIDGSTLLVSKYKGNLIVRTRGTLDASLQPLNGWEIEILKQKYPKAFNNSWVESEEMTVVYEWCSPLNKIVIDYGTEPILYLTGAIYHADYRYVTQTSLDTTAKAWGVPRPRSFSYSSVEEMKNAVEQFKGMEGLCVYYNNGQSIRKVKGAEYLCKHRMKSELSNIEKVLDVWLIAGKPAYQEFFAYCEEAFDYEIANEARGMISNICDAHKEVEEIVSYMKNFVAPLSPLKRVSRRDAAAAIMQAYGQTNRSGMAFKLLDGKQLNEEDYKKLIYQVLKK